MTAVRSEAAVCIAAEMRKKNKSADCAGRSIRNSFYRFGDYHYISKIMTDFIKEPFTLVLIDHHTDMQDASLGGDILSCGNWAKKVLQENPYLQRLVLIGQEKKVLDKLQSGARQQETDGKLVEISYEELKTERHMKNKRTVG